MKCTYLTASNHTVLAGSIKKKKRNEKRPQWTMGIKTTVTSVPKKFVVDSVVYYYCVYYEFFRDRRYIVRLHD